MSYQKEEAINRLRELREEMLDILDEYGSPDIVAGFHYSVYERDHQNQLRVLDAFSISNITQESMVGQYMGELQKDLARIRAGGEQAVYRPGAKLICIDSDNFDPTYIDVPKKNTVYTVKDAFRSLLSPIVYLKFEELNAGPQQFGYVASRFMPYEMFTGTRGGMN